MNRGAAALAGLLAALVVAASALGAARAPGWPGRYDQSAYLDLALAARRGAFPWDGTRGPLYPWLVAPWAAADPATFAAARLVAASAAALAAGAAGAIGARLGGPVGGVAAALAVAAPTEFWTLGARATAESTLAALVASAALAALRGRWTAAGALVGLAYLAKTSALLAVPGLALAAGRDRGARAAGAAVGASLAAASPLLVRNLATRGDPFYSWPSRHALWMDSWGEHWSGPAPTWRTYVETHTAGEAAARLGRGLIEEARLDAPLLLAAAIGAAALALRRPRPLEARRLATFLLPTLGLFFVLFAWYPVRDARFLYPLRAPLWGLAALPFAALGPDARRRVAGLLAAVAAVALVVRLPARAPVSPLHDDLRALLDWRRASGLAWRDVAVDPHDDVLPGAWLEPADPAPLPADPWSAEASCLVVTRHALLGRREAFRPFVEFGPVRDGAPVVVREAPAGWRAVLTRPSVAVLCRRSR